MSRRVLRFALIGGIGFGVDAGTTFILSRLGVSPFIARVPAIAAAILVTWALNRRYTFNLQHKGDAGELVRYFTVALLSAVLNYAIYSGLVIVGVQPVLSVGIASVALMAVSFFGYKIIAFRIKH